MTENERARPGVDSVAGSRGNPLRGGSVTTTHVTAPDFGRGRPYPSAGKRIGPAWRAAWCVLGDGEWHSSFRLVAVMRVGGPVSAKTARQLLRGARRAGLVAVGWTRNVGPSGAVRAFALYRRPDVDRPGVSS